MTGIVEVICGFKGSIEMKFGHLSNKRNESGLGAAACTGWVLEGANGPALASQGMDAAQPSSPDFRKNLTLRGLHTYTGPSPFLGMVDQRLPSDAGAGGRARAVGTPEGKQCRADLRGESAGRSPLPS
jgi:hypothetical protein